MRKTLVFFTAHSMRSPYSICWIWPTYTKLCPMSKGVLILMEAMGFALGQSLTPAKSSPVSGLSLLQIDLIWSIPRD